MSAEVLLDAVVSSDGQPERVSTACRTTATPPQRSIMLPDESFNVILSWTCSAGRNGAAPAPANGAARPVWVRRCTYSIPRRFHGKVARGGRADALARDPRPDAAKVEELFPVGLCPAGRRRPTSPRP